MPSGNARKSSARRGAEEKLGPRPRVDVTTPQGKWIAKIFAGAVAYIGVVAGTIVSIYAAIELMLPDLQPRDHLSGVIESIGVTNDVPLWAVLPNLSPSQGYPEEPGIEIIATANLQAFQDRFYSMHILVMDPRTMKVIENKIELPNGKGPVRAWCETKEVEAKEYVATWKCWAAPLEPGAEYIVRALLVDKGAWEQSEQAFDGSDEVLGFLDSSTYVFPKDD